ncbi:hypothetical protein [Persicobacter psychrovividus]|uniref:Uncharacterized protein n=1 Tax=Persicobacter psychrovividus TaxID=387638 RepID=A0ABN6LFY6_9BACT|nr:hypothetical protein PEPS_43650 [Persicobacter psychrovividus]
MELLRTLNILPQSSTSNALSYNATYGGALTDGYTSAAGNTYQNGIRLSDDLLVVEDIGHGYSRSFLNGIRIYSRDKKTLIAERRFHCYFYNKQSSVNEAVELLEDEIYAAARRQNHSLRGIDVRSKCRQAIGQVMLQSANKNFLLE